MPDNRARIAVALLPALLALALRLYQLAAQPLWLDEVITHNRALLPLPALISDSLINKHFPSYFILVRAFDAPLIDEWTLRLPSAIFGSLAVLMVALIATEVRSPRAGLAAGLLMALSPIDVQFSQEARSYALVSFLILLALWGLVRIAKLAPAGRSALQAPPWGPARGMVAAWAAAIGGTIAALYTLTLAAVWWLASNLAFIVIAINAGTKRMLIVRVWLAAQAFIALAWLPAFAILVYAGGGEPLRGYRWIPSSTWQHVSAVLSSVYLYRASELTTFTLLPTPVSWLGFAVLALALFGAGQLRRSPRRLAVVGFAWLAMPLAMLVVSVIYPVWVPRYLMWSTGPYYVLAGVGAAALPRRTYPFALAVLAIAGAFNLAPYYRTEAKPRWDLAADYLAANTRPGDGIVANGYQAKYVLGAYARRTQLALPIFDGGDAARTAAQLSGTGRVWLVYGRTGQGRMIPEQEYLRKWAALGPPVATVRFGRHVVAWRFEPQM